MPFFLDVAVRVSVLSIALGEAILLDDHRVLAPYVDVCSRAIIFPAHVISGVCGKTAATEACRSG